MSWVPRPASPAPARSPHARRAHRSSLGPIRLDETAAGTVTGSLRRHTGLTSNFTEREQTTMRPRVMLRHGESMWIKENRFAGWTNVPLSDPGPCRDRQRPPSPEGGRLHRRSHLNLGARRAIHTLRRVLDKIEQPWIPTMVCDAAAIADCQAPRTGCRARKSGGGVAEWIRRHEKSGAPATRSGIAGEAASFTTTMNVPYEEVSNHE